MQKVTVKIKKLNHLASIPVPATKGAACFDLKSTGEGVVLAAGSKTFGTGLSFEIPEGYAMMIYSRSGHGFNNGVRLANCVGVIDSDYRGEVKVKLTSDDRYYNMGVEVGQSIAQAMIVPVPVVAFEEVEDLSETARGEGGFGSTG